MRSDRKSSRTCNIAIALISVAGIFLSVYAYHVETSVHSDPHYRALCDISEHMSCSKVFSSKYGTGLGIIGHIVGSDNFINQPNSVYGMIFYTIQGLLAFKSSPIVALLQVVNSVVSCATSLYLAYILVFILNDLCIVCVSTYIVNISLLVCSVIKLRKVNEYEAGRKQRNASKKAS